jgi:hypothetical protein
MAKATHSGTCQVCGRIQKLPGGMLSKHGYTKQWGFFNGTCWGADALPFEQGIYLIEQSIAMATEQRNKNAAASERYKAGELSDDGKAWFHSYKPATFRDRGGYFWETLVVLPVDEKMRGRFMSVKDGKNNPIDGLSYTVETVDEARVFLNSNYAEHVLDKSVAELNRYIDWQKARIANWKPSALIPVK